MGTTTAFVVVDQKEPCMDGVVLPQKETDPMWLVDGDGDAIPADTTNGVDFISELPLDIVTDNIIPRIMGQEGRASDLRRPRNYFALCTTWMPRISQSDDTIQFNLECNKLSTREDWMRVRAMSVYIKKLSLTAYSTPTICDLTRYATGSFPSLEKLSVTGKDDDF